MSAQPDANHYQRMLGLPEDVREPDHYQLLNLDRFTSDEKAIRDAAADQNRKLMGWQISEAHHKDARRLMLKLVEARGVLLDPQKKAAYDRQLNANNVKKEKRHAPKRRTRKKKPVRADEPTDHEMDWLTDDLITTFERGGQKIRPKKKQMKPKETPQLEDDEQEVFPIGSAGRDRQQKVPRQDLDRNPYLNILAILFRWGWRFFVSIILLAGLISLIALLIKGGEKAQFFVIMLLIFGGIVWWNWQSMEL